jgi:hypothetical protein
MKAILIHALLAWFGLCYQKIAVYIGRDAETSAGFPISAYPDVLLDTTIISSKDFACTEANDCTFEPTVKKMSYMGTELKYYEAYAQMNVIKQPFPTRYNFRYLVRDDNNFGSIVGMNRNSTYLDYLYKEDKKMGYTIIFRLGWNNTLTYKLGVYETDKLHAYYIFDTNVTIHQNGVSSSRKLKFCLNNRLDRNPDDLSILGIKESSYQSWYDTLTSESALNQTASNKSEVVFQLFSPSGFNIGGMDFKLQDFISPTGAFRIKKFSPEFDEGRGCDIYSGALMLKKYDFKFYYIEYQEGYEVKFGYHNFNGPEPEPVTKSKGLLWKIILIIVVLIVIGFVYYKYIHARNPDDEIAHYGRVEGEAPIEMQQHR